MTTHQDRATLKIYLLGTAEVYLHGKGITGLLSKTQALLFYLAVTRQPQLRTTMATLLWGEVSEQNARANLRKAIQHLRAALPDHFHSDRESVALHNDAATWVDAVAFAAQTEQTEQMGSRELIQSLDSAIQLYRDDFLVGFHVRNAPDFGNWQLLQRDRLCERMVETLVKLAQLWGVGHEFPRAIATVRRLLALEPWREEAHQQLMCLLAQNGQRDAALVQFERCREALQRELDVEPSAATLDLVTQIRTGTLAPAPPMQPSLSPSQPTHRVAISTPPTVTVEFPLVGRAEEWQAVQTLWHNLEQPHLLCIGGEAGIGKTRLAKELLLLAEQEGSSVARTRSHALQGQLAYTPIADWLRSLPLQVALMKVEDVWRTEVARLLPELLAEQPGLPPPEPLHESWQRTRFFDALLQVFSAVEGTLLLVLDDLQWTDEETLEWLQYLVARSERKLLVIGTVRTDELNDEHLLHRIHQQLARRDRFTELPLLPLDVTAATALATQVAQQQVTDDTAARLFDDTAGNPLFVVESMRANAAKTVVTPTPIHFGNIRSQEQRFVPAKIHRVIQARLAQLSPMAQTLTQLGATIGCAFDVTLLAKAAALDETTVLRSLDELWQRRVLVEVDAARFDFNHDRIRDVAYSEISPLKRRLLHRNVADALAAIHRDNLDAVCGHLAIHCEAAGRLSQAVEFYQRAADRARNLYAHQEAKRLYTCAIKASLQVIPPLDEAQQLHLYDGRAQVCRSLTHLDEAIADWEIVRRMAQRIGNYQKQGDILCHLAYTHWLTFLQDRIPLIKQYAEEAIECVQALDDSPIRGRALTMLGAVDQIQRNLPEAGRKLAEALQINRQAQNPNAVAETLAFLCLQNYLLGDFPATVQVGRQSAAAAHAVHNDLNELRSQAFVCQAEWSLGNYAHAFMLVQQTMAQAAERENQFIQGRMLNTLGWFHQEFGDFATAIAYNQQSVELGRSTGVNHVELSALINLSYDYLLFGEYGRAQALFNSTLERVEREGVGSHKWQWQMKLLIGLAELAFATGNHEQALHHVEAGLNEAQAAHCQKYVVKARVLLGRVLMQLGEQRAAGEALHRASALATTLRSPALLYPAVSALGSWHAAVGNEAEAALHQGQVKTIIIQMATAIADDALAATLMDSVPVQIVLAR